MHIESIVTIITTPRLRETRDFYARHFGFEVTFDCDSYTSLRAGPEGAPEIAFMTRDEDAPAEFAGGGVTFAFAVPDADAAHRQLVAAGVPIVAPPLDKPFGARSFVVCDPNGVRLFVSHPLAQTPVATDVG